jgi:hypothetical protein
VTKNLPTDLNSGKRALLEASVYALQEGEALLQKLEQLWQMTAIDSRSDFVRPSITKAIGKVGNFPKKFIQKILGYNLEWP